MKKLILRAVLVLILLVVIAGVVGYLFLDSIAKAGIEKGGTYALGVDTKVQSLDLAPFSGTLTMDGLNVANPKGFASPHLMHSGRFDLELVPGSLLGDAVHVRKFVLDGLDVNVEQKGLENNISKVMEHLKRLGGGGQAEPQQEEGTKVKIDRIVIRNVKATFHIPAVRSLEVKVPQIEMENIRSEDGGGVVLPKVIAQIVPAVLAGVLREGKDILPADLLNGLNADVTGVAEALGGQAQKAIANVQGELGRQVGKVAGDVQKTVEGTVGGLLGGKKPDANQPAAVGKVAGDVKKTVEGAVGGLLGGKKPDANRPKAPEKPAGGLLDGLLGGKKGK